MAPWLWAVGVTLEIVWVVIVVGPLLRLIFRRQRPQIAARGWLFPRGGPVESDIEDIAYALVGALVLAVGFAVQMSGYVVAYGDVYLLAAAVAILASCLVGGVGAAQSLTHCLVEKARQNDPTAHSERERTRSVAARALRAGPGWAR